MRGFIKIFRKTVNNRIYKEDPTAWRVFFHLLLRADRQTGSWSTTKQKLALELGIKPSTIYDALRRLQTAKMVNLETDRNETLIHICKWFEYQEKTDRSTDPKKAPNRPLADRSTMYTRREEEKELTFPQELLHEGSSNIAWRDWLKETNGSIPYQEWIQDNWRDYVK